jgi:NTP pyrophosphatase (non-canonical NTP hydrolase)
MNMLDIDEVLKDVKTEIGRAREKFPKSTDLLPALVEEVGELSQALLQQKHEPNKDKGSVDIYKEAIQVACAALRLATEGEPNFPLYEPRVGSVLHRVNRDC